MIAFLVLALSMTNTPKPTLIYIGDPMCSWCYGFSEELEEIVAHFDEDVAFEIVQGGLRPYNTETMADLGDFLKHHWEDVNKASGQPFSYDILSDTKITYDTEPPCRANVVVRKMMPEKALAFFKATQVAFYVDNKNMHLSESYSKILKSLEIDEIEFNRLFHSPEMKEAVKRDFERAAKLGVRSFPTLILQKDGQHHLIVNGYAKSEVLIQSIQNIIKK